MLLQRMRHGISNFERLKYLQDAVNNDITSTQSNTEGSSAWKKKPNPVESVMKKGDIERIERKKIAFGKGDVETHSKEST